MTFDEFDRMFLTVRWAENEPSSGFHRVYVSPGTYEAIRAAWSWATPDAPRLYAASTAVADNQIVVER